MNRLHGTASMNGSKGTSESINTNNLPIRTVSASGVKWKQLRLITWNTRGKYISLGNTTTSTCLAN